MGETIDLFANISELPSEVQDIVNSFNDYLNPYEECERLLKELKPYGYTFEYGLCGTPFDLSKI